MNDLQNYLANLEVYPGGDQIDEASNYAQEEATKYVLEIDPNAIVTVEEGEVYVKSEVDNDFDDAQTIFDECFSERIEELQSDLTQIDVSNFREVPCDDFTDFQENADFGQKWADENGDYHYKIKSPRTGDPISFYYKAGNVIED